MDSDQASRLELKQVGVDLSFNPSSEHYHLPGPDEPPHYHAGPYSLNAQNQTPEKLAEDQRRSDLLPQIESFFAKRFASLSISAYERNCATAAYSHVPSWASSDFFTLPNGMSFGSNLVITCDEFVNKAHFDLDATDYAFGVFFLVDRLTGKIIISPPGLCVEIDDASFRFPEYNFEIAFGKKNMLVEMVWRTKTLHRSGPSLTIDVDGLVTTPEASGVTHFGSSIQVTDLIVKRLEGLRLMKEVMPEKAWHALCKASCEGYSSEIQKRWKQYHAKLKGQGLKLSDIHTGGSQSFKKRKKP